MLTSFDVLAAAVALTVMSAGLTRRRSFLKLGRREELSRDLGGLLKELLGGRRILNRRWTGLFHLAFIYGVGFHLLLALTTQFRFTVPPGLASLFSFLADMLGALMLLGTVFFLVRYAAKDPQQKHKGTLLPVITLLIILLAGFMAAGARLHISQSPLSPAAPVDWLFSSFSPASPLFMQLMFRLHFFGVLFLIAMVPFTFLRHLPADLFNVYYRPQNAVDALIRPNMESGRVGAETIADLSWKQLLDTEACVSCGRCDENCPPFLAGKGLSPQKVIQAVGRQMVQAGRNVNGGINAPLPLLTDAVSTDDVWSCTLCMACFEHCPVYIPVFDKITEMRRHLVMMKSHFYPETGAFFKSLEIFGDTFGRGKAFRADWAAGLNIKTISVQEPADVLFWVGCQASFHEKGRLIAAALAKVFDKAGLDLAILGKEEICCGDPLRRVGNEYLFQQLARKNIQVLKGLRFNRIVTYCPHCHNMLKNEYPQLGGRFYTIHYTELLRELFARGDLHVDREYKKRVVYHDPCYLARAAHITREPREILSAVPGIHLLEPNRAGEATLCCGAGGGHMWIREGPGEKLNGMRIRELLAQEPDMIVTSCPYCLVMFDDALRNMGADAKCADMAELLRDLV